MGQKPGTLIHENACKYCDNFHYCEHLGHACPEWLLDEYGTPEMPGIFYGSCLYCILEGKEYPHHEYDDWEELTERWCNVLATGFRDARRRKERPNTSKCQEPNIAHIYNLGYDAGLNNRYKMNPLCRFFQKGFEDATESKKVPVINDPFLNRAYKVGYASGKEARKQHILYLEKRSGRSSN